MRGRLSSKGQITVPARVRAALGLRPGSAVEFVVRDGEAVIRKHGDDDPIDAVYGTLSLDRGVDELIVDMRGAAPDAGRRRRTRSARGRRR